MSEHFLGCGESAVISALGVKVATVYRHDESSAVYGFLFVCALDWQPQSYLL